MSDRPSVFQLVSVGREATHGAHAIPAQRLGALSIDLAAEPTVQTFRPSGFLVHTVAATNYEQASWSAEGIGTYNEITAPLRMLLGAPETTNPATGVFLHTFRLNSSASTPQQTYTAVAGDASRNAWTRYLLLTQAQMTATASEGLQLRAQGLARRFVDDGYRRLSVVGGPPTGGTWDLTVGSATASGLAYNATATAVQTALALAGVSATVLGGPFPATPLHVFFNVTPGAISVTDSFTPGGDVEVARDPNATLASLIPVVGAQITHRTALTYAGLASATDLTRVFSWQLSIDNRAGPIRPMDASGTFAGHVELAPTAKLTVQVGADATGMAMLQQLRSNERIFWRMRAVGGVIAGTSNYTLEIDACMLLDEVRIIRDADGIVQASFGGTLAHDPTWGRALEIRVQNGDATAL